MSEELGELPVATSKGKVKLAVIVGHTSEARGARMTAPINVYEYDYNLEIAQLMQKFSDSSYANMELVVILRDDIGIHGAYKKARDLNCDCVVELHFNSFDSRATGTETLCTSDGDDMEFAYIIHKKVCEVFSRDGDSRGVKALSKSARGAENVHSFPCGANCLIEPGFGDNPSDANLLMARKEEYAESLVRAVYSWALLVGLVH